MRTILACVLLTLLAAPVAGQDRGVVSYQLRYDRVTPERIRITVTPAAGIPTPAALVMPRAIPMGYAEQPYDRFVDHVTAFSAAGAPLPVRREEGPRWTIGGPGATLGRLSYDVDLGRMERLILDASCASKVRPRYAGLLGYSVFAYLEGLERSRIRLEVDAPKDWPVFSTLAPQTPLSMAQVIATAADFYALADSQVAMGPDLRVSRVNAAVPLYLAVYAEGDEDMAVEGEVARGAFEAVSTYFGDIPFAHYTLLVELLRPISPEHEYHFSMEHLDSSTYYLGTDRALTNRSTPAQKLVNRFNYAHHITHAWIPKRSYGEGYFPFSWELAPMIDTIWLSEGLGRWIGGQALADALPASESAAYLRAKEKELRDNLAQVPAFIRNMPLVQLSRIASTRYGSDFRTGRTLYSRGGLMATEMDRLIRERTGGKKSLRDALRHLVAWSRQHQRGFRLDELPVILTEATGVDVNPILQRWLEPR